MPTALAVPKTPWVGPEVLGALGIMSEEACDPRLQ